jgi:hypothetical protein
MICVQLYNVVIHLELIVMGMVVLKIMTAFMDIAILITPLTHVPTLHVTPQILIVNAMVIHAL